MTVPDWLFVFPSLLLPVAMGLEVDLEPDKQPERRETNNISKGLIMVRFIQASYFIKILSQRFDRKLKGGALVFGILQIGDKITPCNYIFSSLVLFFGHWYDLDVNKKDLNNFLKSIVPDAYSFSYICIPDDLQAQQVVIDTIIAMSLKESTSFLAGKEDEKQRAADLADLKIRVFKNVFELAKKRFFQIGGSIRPIITDSNQLFFQLELSARASIFLNHRLKISNDDIVKIVSEPRHQVLAHINSSRDQLLKGEGQIANRENA